MAETGANYLWSLVLLVSMISIYYVYTHTRLNFILKFYFHRRTTPHTTLTYYKWHLK